MSTDLSDQIRELMERGVRPVSMADVRGRAPARVTPLRRVAARSGRGRGPLILAAAVAVAACLALAVTVLIPGGTGPGGPPARLAAWTVVKQPGGSVMVTLHQVRDPAPLQRTLRADGIPARVVFAKNTDPGSPIPGCHVYPIGGAGGTPLSVWGKVFFGPHTKVANGDFWIYPSAIPPGMGVVVSMVVGRFRLTLNPGGHVLGGGSRYSVTAVGLYLVKASPRCTGS
jgi:hypothetical protein